MKTPLIRDSSSTGPFWQIFGSAESVAWRNKSGMMIMCFGYTIHYLLLLVQKPTNDLSLLVVQTLTS